MESVLKWSLAALAVVVISWVIVGVFTKEVGASVVHTAWVNDGSAKWSGVCKAEAPACNQVSEGTETGSQKQECKLLGGGGGFPCLVGQKRTIEVSRGCEVEGDVCTEEGSCSEACGTEATEVPDGNGGYKVCEATPACVVPEEPKKDSKRVSFTYTQGSDKGLGDEMCRLKWKDIDGSSKVEIRYAEDGVFGNGYKTIKTKDDGSYWVNVVGGLFKIRGRDSMTEWSKARDLEC